MAEAMETKRNFSPAKCGLLVSLGIFPFLLCAGVIWKLTLLEGFPLVDILAFARFRGRVHLSMRAGALHATK